MKEIRVKIPEEKYLTSFEPERTNSLLEKILLDKLYKRKFDYRIDFDEDWKLTEWHLKNS